MRCPVTFLLMSAILFFAFCCKASSNGEAAVSPVGESAVQPPLPSESLSPEEKGAFMLRHYWDLFDFADTLRSRDTEFMEQSFAGYAPFLIMASDTAARKEAVRSLMKKAEADNKVYNLLASIASRYLYDPDSPVLDEEAYIPFLEIFAQSPFLSEAQRGRSLFLLQAALKNRPGTFAADFPYITREGNDASLYSTPVKGNLLLIFYDPDCDNCREIISWLAGNEEINNQIKEGKLTVLAVYSGDDEELWRSTSHLLPGEWLVGFDKGAIDEADSYYFRTSPTLYLLDSEKRVILKDFSPLFFS